MVSLPRLWPSRRTLSPPPAVTTLAAANGNGRTANLAALSSTPIAHSGIASYGGVLHYPEERDAAWQPPQRDQTIMAMMNHPVIGGVLMAIEMFVRRVPWYVDPVDDSEEAKDVADFYQDCLDELRGVWPGETMARILTYLGWGWSAHEVVYKQRDDGRIGWEQWRLIPQHTRYGWEFDERDEPITLLQSNYVDRTKPALIRVPLDRCLVFRYASRDNTPEGFTPLRLAWDAYYYQTSFRTLEGILFERFGGLQVARIPGADIAAKNDTYREMQRIVTTLGVNAQTGLVLASDRDPSTNEFYQDFQIVSPESGATVPSADPIIRRYAQEMVGVFLANVVRTGQDGTGSYALADVHSGLFQQGIAAHLDTIADAINTQTFGRLAELNAIPDEMVPSLKHGDIEDADLAALGAYLEKLSGANMLEDTPELRVHLHEEAGLPVPTVDEIRERQEEEARQAQLAQRDALRTVPQNGAAGQPEGGQNGVAGSTASDAGTPVAASEMPSQIRTLVEPDGSLTLSDMLAIMEWWRDAVPAEYADLLDARVMTDG